MTNEVRVSRGCLEVSATRSRIVAQFVRSARLPTPCLVIDPAEIDRLLGLFRECLPDVRLHYSVKANDAPLVLRHFSDRACGFEAVSDGEIRSLAREGIEPSRIILSNPILTPATLQTVFDVGIPLVTVDAPDALRAVAREAQTRSQGPPKILIRRRVAASMAEVDLGEKFGCERGELPALFLLARSLGLELVGLHFHVGSQCLDSTAYQRAAEAVLDDVVSLGRLGFEPQVIDIGGGMPDAAAAERIGGLEAFLQSVGAALRPLLAEGFTLFAEPGRSLVSSAGYAVCSVVSRSVREGRDWLFLDDGIYGLLSNATYERRRFEFIHDAPDDAPRRPFTLAGPTCDSLDVLGEVELAGSPEPGCLLVAPNAGAYSYSVRTSFNGFSADRVFALGEPEVGA